MYDIPYSKDPRKQKASLDFTNIFKEAKLESERMRKMEQQQVTTLEYGSLANPYVYNMEGFVNRFSNIDSMSDSDLAVLVHQNYTTILDAINNMPPESQDVNNPYYVSLVGLFTNMRFVTILCNILRNEKQLLGLDRTIYLNRIIYNYTTVPAKKDITIERLLIDLGDIINADDLPILLQIGLPRNIASKIAVARRSSKNEEICIKRVNLIIYNTGDLSIMNEQMIVDIYQYLFNNSVSSLFNGIMFDVYSKQDLNNATEDQREIYSLCVTAVLELLKNMPTASIRMVLSSYSMAFINNPRPVRCSLNLSNDYYRINEVIDYLEKNEGIYLP